MVVVVRVMVVVVVVTVVAAVVVVVTVTMVVAVAAVAAMMSVIVSVSRATMLYLGGVIGIKELHCVRGSRSEGRVMPCRGRNTATDGGGDDAYMSRERERGGGG